jgi:alkylated DNA repair dioxygenase AlkB
MPTYDENFIAPGDMFSRLWNELSWERRSDAPRREYWVNSLGRSYTYGHGAGERTYEPKDTHEVIEKVTDALEARLGFRYEGCFLNGYESERDALGWHADDDPGIDHAFPIAVVSLYGEGAKNNLRSILIKEKPVKGETTTISAEEMKTKLLSPIDSYTLADGSLFLMDAGMQSTHVHKIPKAGFVARPRISLTFRKLIFTKQTLWDVIKLGS